ncbi:MAG: asparaginase domain-containing protein [Pseudomonadota bacterium]
MLPDMDNVLVITTGGTIDKVYFDAKSEYEVGGSVILELLEEAHVACPFSVQALMRKDSLDLTDADRDEIRGAVAAAATRRIVITHGTDTMTDTARAIAPVVRERAATVVLTGALSPARFARSDATFNVGMAFATVQAVASGTYITMNGQVFDALAVVKDRAQNCFVARQDSGEG